MQALEARLKAMEVRLQALEDRTAIKDLIASRYGKALDTADADAYAGIFTEDAFLSVAGRPFKGGSEIRKMMLEIKKGHAQYDTRPENMPGGRWGSVRHVVTNPLFSISGNTATTNSYSTEIDRTGGTRRCTAVPRAS